MKCSISNQIVAGMTSDKVVKIDFKKHSIIMKAMSTDEKKHNIYKLL